MSNSDDVTSTSERKNIRVAIYTIKDEENLAVYDRIGPITRPFTGRSGQRYTLASIKTSNGAVTVALFKGVHQGQREAQTLVQRAISDLSPDWVLVVGIAGGASHSDITIGDVVVASEILDFSYEVKRDADKPSLHPRTLPLHRSAHAVVSMLPVATRQISNWSSESEAGQKPKPPQISQILDSVVGSYRPNIAKAIEYHLANPRIAPVAHSGTVGTSDALMKSTEFLEQLTGTFKFLLCIEMEAAGAWAACNTDKSTPLIAIRGISDIVGVDRSQAWTQYACDTAASLAVGLIRSGQFNHLEESAQIESSPTAVSDVSDISVPPAVKSVLTSSSKANTPIFMALRNIRRFGDTDIFPRPYELGAFRDLEEKSASLLERVDSDFANFFPQYPPSHLSTLSQLGYAGFRWASQLDPLYNASLLALTIGFAPKLESVRVRTDRQCVFSYRYEPEIETGRLFNDETSWDGFLEKTKALSGQHAWVVKTDVADFYAHVSHERLRRTLSTIESNESTINRLMSLLSSYSGSSGVGLPVGGPAARILAEAYLNASDHLLMAKGIRFCRFADDYIMFARTEHEATDILAELAMVLAQYEGLSLQKMKTRIMRKTEYLRSHFYEADSDLDKDSLSFLRLRLKYDPYSPTADEDYETLREHLSDYNVLGMLAAEMRKSRIHQQLTKKLLFAARYVEDEDVDSAVITIVESVRSLLTVFPSVSAVLFALLPRTQENTMRFVQARFAALLESDDSPTLLDLHKMIAVRILASLEGDDDSEISNIIWRQWNNEDSVLIKKECIWGLIRKKGANLLAGMLDRFERSSPWERRALLVASYSTDGAGILLRRQVAQRISPYESLISEWAESRGGSIFSESV